MKTLKLLSIIFSLLVIFSCSIKPRGTDYLGKWTDGKTVMKIKRIGESFLVEGTYKEDGVYTITKENNLIMGGKVISFDEESYTLVLCNI
jgi:hypothetical protein